jgi:hypothetical protein
LVVVRKNISVQKGETVLLEDIKYFFYITNHTAYQAWRAFAPKLLSLCDWSL